MSCIDLKLQPGMGGRSVTLPQTEWEFHWFIGKSDPKQLGFST